MASPIDVKEQARRYELVSLFIVLTAIGTLLSLLLYLVRPSDPNSALMISCLSLVAAGCASWFWTHIRDQLVVFSVFAGFGVLFMYLLDRDAPNVVECALRVGASAGIAGSGSWKCIYGSQQSPSDVRWILAGAVAGLVFHPLIWLFYSVTGELTLIAYPILMCYFLLLFGCPTMFIGFVAAGICQFLLSRTCYRKQAPASEAGAC